MDKPVITTNNVPRDILDYSELTEKEREEFDYLDAAAILEGRESAFFFRYKGNVYDLGDCERPRSRVYPGWDGYYSETFFSGILFRYVEEFERVVVGRYYA